jgi:hypothetical protein
VQRGAARRLQVNLPHQVVHDFPLLPRSNNNNNNNSIQSRKQQRNPKGEGGNAEDNLVLAVELDEAMHGEDLRAGRAQQDRPIKRARHNEHSIDPRVDLVTKMKDEQIHQLCKNRNRTAASEKIDSRARDT